MRSIGRPTEGQTRHWVTTSWWLLSLIWPALASGAASPARRDYDRARVQYFSLKDSPKRQQYRHNWLKVIAGFSKVVSAHPTSETAPLAQYTVAELWSDLYLISRRESDLDHALSSYKQVYANYGESSLADDALYQRATLLLERRGDRVAAAALVRRLLARYPSGDMAARANGLSRQLRDVPPPTAEPERPVTKNGEPDTLTGQLVGHREGAGPTPTVTDIKHWSNPVYTRVAIYLTGPAQARAGVAPADTKAHKPARVFADISRARLSKQVAKPMPVNDDLLQQIRVGQFKTNTVRVVLDLKADVRQRVMVMENPYRVVIDAFSTAEKTKPPPTEQPPPLALKGRHVVIDPGHGGKDGGAGGPGKLTEKRVVLEIGRQVARQLKAAGIQVTLTRDRDEYLPLEERTAIANRANADLFVSIHANSNKVKKVRGIETYYLDVTDDAYALRLAALENKTNQEQVSDLQLILADLATKVNTEESKSLAKAVQKRLVETTHVRNPRGRDLGVKPSLFYVLLGARMPSILVETGFLSNREEGRLLGRSDYQRLAAEAIADGIIDHLRRAH